jgi:hypothetical protein
VGSGIIECGSTIGRRALGGITMAQFEEDAYKYQSLRMHWRHLEMR